MSDRGGSQSAVLDSPPPRSAGPGRYVVALVVVAAVYYLGARLGLSLAVIERNVTPLWPPTGIAVAAYLLAGRSMWPAVAVAAFAVNLPISPGPLAAAATAVGNTVAPLVAALLLRRVGFRRQMDRGRDALALVFLAALASMLVSATVGSLTLLAAGTIDPAGFVAAWAVWWTGDAMGVLVVTPFVLCLPLFWERTDWAGRQWVEEGVVLCLVLAVSLWASTTHLHGLFLVLTVVGWSAWRLQLRAAAPAALIASLVTSAASANGRGPFGTGSLAEQMLTLQAFNACVALTSLFLAALVRERIVTAQALVAAAREEHRIAETLQRSLLPDGLPDIARVGLAARYLPASGVDVGGDWYDVVPLPKGLVGVAIGDVAGHGLYAAATMGQFRMAVRAYALQDPAPAAVMRGIRQLALELPITELATILYLVYDPATGVVRYSNAGHPPALVVGADAAGFVEAGLTPPIGAPVGENVVESSLVLAPGTTMLLYTDGLVERRGVSIQDGLDRLHLEASRRATSDLQDLCDHVVRSLVDPHNIADDVALVALRPSVPVRDVGIRPCERPADPGPFVSGERSPAG